MPEIKTNIHHKIVDTALFWISVTLIALVFIRGLKEVYIEDMMYCLEICKPFEGLNKIYFDLTGKMCECNNKMNFKIS